MTLATTKLYHDTKLIKYIDNYIEPGILGNQKMEH